MELAFLLLLIGVLAGALLTGYPVALSLAGAAVLTIAAAGATGALFLGDAAAFFENGGPVEWLTAGLSNMRGLYWDVSRDTLIAVPLFVFMGVLLQRSKIAEDLLVSMSALFGAMRGGLGISVVIVGALLAATTGIVGATVIAMSLVSAPAMLRQGYSKSLAAGTIAASGTLGQIIPPSIVLIILADQLANAGERAQAIRQENYRALTGQFSMPTELSVLSTSAGELFLGALVPGLILVALYILYLIVTGLVRPEAMPAAEVGTASLRAGLGQTIRAVLPPLALIVAVLGSILTGVATVNQAGAVGASGAILLTAAHVGGPGAARLLPLALAGLGLACLILAVRAPDTLAGLGIPGATVLVVALLWSVMRLVRADGLLRDVSADTVRMSAMVFLVLMGAALFTAAFRGFGGEAIVADFLGNMPGGFWVQLFVVLLLMFALGFFLDFLEISVLVVPIVAPILLADPGANVTAVWLGVLMGMIIQTSFLTPPFGFALFYFRGAAPREISTRALYRGVVPFIGLQLLATGLVLALPPLTNYLPNRALYLSELAPPPRNPLLGACLDDYAAFRFEADAAEIKSALTELDRSPPMQDAVAKTRAALAAWDDLTRAQDELERFTRQNAAVFEAMRMHRLELVRVEATLKELSTQIRRAESEAERTALERQRDAALKLRDSLQQSPDTHQAEMGKTRDSLRQAYQRARSTALRAGSDAGEAWDALPDTQSRDVEPVATFVHNTLALRDQDGMNREQALFVARCRSHHTSLAEHF